jgi:hypothetical protein
VPPERYREMANAILSGTLTPTTRSEVVAITKGLAVIRREDVAQRAFDRMTQLPIVEVSSGGSSSRMDRDSVEKLIRKALKESPHA